jgi:hypothetical protein
MGNNIEFFNIRGGESAVVRILSTTVDKIERIGIHTIELGDGTKKKVRCLESNCPLCDDDKASERLALHLWDYTDNKEKVWNRTTNEKFVNLLRDVEENWGNLSECVVKITRENDDFPQYSVTVQNPNKYPMPNEITKEDIDRNVGYRCCTYRSADELAEFLKTGYLPDHIKKQPKQEWVPKDQWLKNKNKEEIKKNNEDAMRSYEAIHTNNTFKDTEDTEDTDVFIDPFARRKA